MEYSWLIMGPNVSNLHGYFSSATFLMYFEVDMLDFDLLPISGLIIGMEYHNLVLQLRLSIVSGLPQRS